MSITLLPSLILVLFMITNKCPIVTNATAFNFGAVSVNPVPQGTDIGPAPRRRLLFLTITGHTNCRDVKRCYIRQSSVNRPGQSSVNRPGQSSVNRPGQSSVNRPGQSSVNRSGQSSVNRSGQS
jgi:hypothetical protein